MTTAADRVALLERALVTSAWIEPGATVIDRPDWFQVTTPSSVHHRKNLVYRAVMSPEAADARVAEVIAAHRARGAQMRWVVGPGCRPLDLGERLVAHGMGQAPDSVGMWCPTDLAVPTPRDVTVERMTSENIQTLVEAFAAGWEAEPSVHHKIRADMETALRVRADTVSGWLARVAGEPAGAGMLLQAPGASLLQGASVVPAFRGRGVYRALIRRRLEALRAAGVGLATIMAQADTSAPICEGVGFVVACRFGYYLLD